MLSDNHVKELFKYFNEYENIAEAAREVGISYPTARRYIQLGKLPSELKNTRPPDKRNIFGTDWESIVVPYLYNHPNASPRNIIELLIDQKPEKYQRNQLRTVQRRLSHWRKQNVSMIDLKEGDLKNLASLCVTGLFPVNSLITIRGLNFRHSILFIYIREPMWSYLIPLKKIHPFNIIEGIEEAFWKFGYIPNYHLHFWEPAWILTQKSYSFENTTLYKRFCQHYQITPVRSNNIRPPGWNLIFEQIHHAIQTISEKGNNFASRQEYFNQFTSLNDSFAKKITDQAWSELKLNARAVPNTGAPLGKLIVK